MLVSPGLEITVIDESQYMPTAVGTVPFVLFATAQDKVFNGSIAPYTTKANAGKLLAVTSQRDLITNFGYPSFYQSSAGTPLHGNEINEYGLMAAYSSLGVVNRMYLIRADIDLAQLIGTAVRPIGAPSDGTYWLDLSNTAWGVYEWNAVTQEFVNRLPLVITSPSATTNIGGILTPNSSIGQIGSYAVVANSPYNFIFYKRSDNVWVQVGSLEWQKAWGTVVGTVANPVITPFSTLVINTVTVTINGSTIDGIGGAKDSINSAAIPGVTAAVVNSKLVLLATSAAMSNGSNADGKISIVDGTSTPAVVMGLMQLDSMSTPISPSVYACPIATYGSYVQVPDFRATDTTPRPSGSVWAKTSILGGGANLYVKMYNANNDVWTPAANPIYVNEAEALFALDPNAGGFAIQAGTIFTKINALANGTVTYRMFIRQTQGESSVTGITPISPMTFASGDSFTLLSTQTGSAIPVTVTITMSSLNASLGAEGFVNQILAANIPEVTAQVETTGAITIKQTQGGTINLRNIVNTPLATAGFTSATPGLRQSPGSTTLVLSNFAPLIYTYSMTQPYTAPDDGTLWYFNSPLDVDIMINETTGWKGYRTVSRDAHGFNLVNTDPAGVILATDAPITQSDGNTALAPGDLWIDTNDLANWPVISRYTGTKWQLIDNTDVISQNGVVFADARWEGWIDPYTNITATSLLDPAAGEMPDTTKMLLSNKVDLDCPDHRLYPRGTLLFNTRRSGYNVKHYVSNYFNEHSYPEAQLDGLLPAQKATWVTSSGLKNDGSPFAGAGAQRAMVVKAMRSAIDSSEILREESFAFNLQATPGYPELISNMVQLNNDRKCTAFTIGDVPMHLKSNIMDITAWSTGAVEGGLTTADPYLAVYYPGGALANDLQGNTIVMPQSHTILRAAIKSDNVSYPWFAYAGTRRGLIDNATDIGYVDTNSGAFVRNGVNQGLRDALYQLNINPVTLLPGVGLTNFGNKTRQGYASSMDRVNVARLINYIRTILAHVGDGFLFEPNDAITRNQIKQVISSAINDLIAKRGVYDYLVICDESNNDNGRIARNELYVDIAIEPMKDVEFIYIPIRLKNPGGIKASGK